jgi:hypothetical protein
MIALVSEEYQGAVERAVMEVGGEVVPLRTGAPGVRREESQPMLTADSSTSTVR